MSRTIALAMATLLVVGSADARGSWYRPYQNGRDALEAGQFARAIALLEYAIEQDPESSWAKNVSGKKDVVYVPYYFLGRAYLERGDCAQAVRALAGERSQGQIERATAFRDGFADTERRASDLCGGADTKGKLLLDQGLRLIAVGDLLAAESTLQDALKYLDEPDSARQALVELAERRRAFIDASTRANRSFSECRLSESRRDLEQARLAHPQLYARDALDERIREVKQLDILLDRARDAVRRRTDDARDLLATFLARQPCSAEANSLLAGLEADEQLVLATSIVTAGWCEVALQRYETLARRSEVNGEVTSTIDSLKSYLRTVARARAACLARDAPTASRLAQDAASLYRNCAHNDGIAKRDWCQPEPTPTPTPTPMPATPPRPELVAVATPTPSATRVQVATTTPTPASTATFERCPPFVDSLADVQYALGALFAGNAETAAQELGDPQRSSSVPRMQCLTHAYLGVAHCVAAFLSSDPRVGAAREAKAIAAFRRALAIESNFRLDPRLVSPSIQAVFNRAKER